MMPRRSNSATLRERLKSAATYVGIVLAMVWTLFPLYWAVLLSLKRRADLYSPWVIPFVQFRPTLENWRESLSDAIGYEGQLTVVRGLANSILLATLASLACLLVGTLAAYGLAHLTARSRLRSGLLGAFLLPRFLAPAANAN